MNKRQLIKGTRIFYLINNPLWITLLIEHDVCAAGSALS